VATIGLIVSVAALVLAVVVHLFTRKSWRESYRPVITVRVLPLKEKTQMVKLLVTNSGNRPAINVKISPQNEEDFRKALAPEAKEWEIKSIESCFKNTVDVIANGETLPAAFGTIKQTDAPGAWKDDPTLLLVKIEYNDLSGNKWTDYSQRLRISSIASFGDVVFGGSTTTTTVVEEIIKFSK
jgi:hypothetical protein